MKKLLLLLLLSLGFVSLSFAHSGRTDSSGGHNDYANGTYHYHNSGNRKWLNKNKSYDDDKFYWNDDKFIELCKKRNPYESIQECRERYSINTFNSIRRMVEEQQKLNEYFGNN